MKILISGGHLTPALAFIDYVQEHTPTTNLVFAGRLVSRKQSAQKAKEKEEVEKRGVLFLPFDSGKFSTHNPITLAINLIHLVGGTLKAFYIVLTQKPNVYLSFGSYISIPLGIACWLLQVPIITHEQTRTVGFATTFLGKLATKVALSFPESALHFPKEKTVVTGNLLRKKVLRTTNTKPQWFTTRSEKKILYVTGGSQGSEILNSTLSQLIKVLTNDWIVIHQCGASTAVRNYKKELERTRDQLGSPAKQQYFVREWISEEELSWIYGHATAVISRAGANTLLELQVTCVPSILIPLPFSHNNEQLISAKALSDTGKALLILQKDLSPASLLLALQSLQSNYETMRAALKKDIPQTDEADKKLYNVVLSAVKHST